LIWSHEKPGMFRSGPFAFVTTRSGSQVDRVEIEVVQES
jgi:hypothetical protein